jgi:3-oxo-5alpha-steroid 4-dehydrogenase
MTNAIGPDSATWFSAVKRPDVVRDAHLLEWDEEADFVVVGYGGAGVAAALQAAEQGLQVIALDRFEGGGSTAMNGGVVYAGGGTAIQKQAAVEDDPEQMFNYLSAETQGVVSDATLRRFCEESPAMIDWLTAHGVRFNSTIYRKKTSYPALRYFLYHSDSSMSSARAAIAKPAARGHKVWSQHHNKTGTGYGAALYTPLMEAALRLGVRQMKNAEVQRLILDQSGRVIGVKVLQFPVDSSAIAEYAGYQAKAKKYLLKLPPSFPGAGLMARIANYYGRKAEVLAGMHRVERSIRARHGVCLSAGGFIFNREMVSHYAPKYRAGMPLGNPGDDGSGIRLGQTAGGAVSRMQHVSGWRFINPPMAFSKGIVVNADGARFCDESLYGATLGYAMCEEHNGKGYVILDAKLYREAWRQVFKDELLPFQRDPAILALLFARRKGSGIPELARKCGFSPETLAAAIASYNRAAGGQHPDPFAKGRKDMCALTDGPFYAIDVSVTSKLFPMPVLTLGGLIVDEETGQVKREDETVIDGLYAAGRTAIGICSHLYVSGLSAADCIFSGRRAGAHAAACAAQKASVQAAA